MTRTRTLGAGLILAAVALTSACNSAEGGPPGTTTSATATPTTTSPSPTPTPTKTLSQAEKDIEAAEEAVEQFWAVRSRLAQTPEEPISELLKVTRGKTYETWARQMQVQRTKRLKQVGDPELVSVEGRATKKVDGRQTIRVDVCYDVSKVNVVDAEGKSVVSPDRVARARASYLVSEYRDGWFVIDDETKAKPC